MKKVYHKLHYTRLHLCDLTRYDKLFAHFCYWYRDIGINSCFSDSYLPHYKTPCLGDCLGAGQLTCGFRFVSEN